MNKRNIHHALVVLRQLQVKHLVILLAVLVMASVFFLRQNNLHMIERRNLVVRADEQNKDIPQAITNLRNYVASHMNTGMGDKGVYLEHSYQRSYEAAVTQAAQGATAGATIYRQADQDCQSKFPKASGFSAYVQCVTDKVGSSGIPTGPITPPSSDLYRFNFVSPAWSPDVAGFTLLLAVLLALLLVGRLLLVWTLYGLLKY
jgi:hypothetical protein